MSNFKKHFGQTNSRNEVSIGHESKSRFHCSLPNSYKAHLEEVQHHSMACLQAMRGLCQSANDMAEGFTTLFQDTPFCEVATNLQHISQELASTTGEVCQHVNDNVNLQTSRLINRGLKEKTDESMQVMAHCFLLMLQTQCQFFNSASQIFEPLVRYQSLEDFFIGDDRDEILKEACSSWLSMSQMTKTLRRGDAIPIGDLVNLSKSQNATDPNMAEIKQRLDALVLTYKYEFVLLPKTDFTMIGGFHLHPQCSALVLNGCCHENHIQSLLNQSQSVLEEMVRYMPKNQSEMPNQEELAKRLKANLHDVTIQVEGEVCKQKPSKENNFQKIVDLIAKLVSKVVKQNGLTLDVRLLAYRFLAEMCPQSTHTQSQIATHILFGRSNLDLIAKLVSKVVKQNGLTLDVRLLAYRFLAEMCPQSTHTQSQIATHILFGRSNLVSIEQVQIENGFHNYVQVSSHGPLLIIEVPTVWSLNLIIPSQSHHAVAGGKSILGKIEVVYTVKFDVVKWNDGKKQLLPTIQVKLCKELNENEQQVVTRQNQYPSSQAESPISGLRKMFGKLNSKFHKKGSSSSKNSNFYVKSSRQGQDTSAQNTVYPAKPALTTDQRHDGQVKVLVSPVVTITSSDNTDTSSNTAWPNEGGEKTKGFATDTEVQNIVDLLSGGHKSPAKQCQHPKVHPETLIVIANPESQERHTSGWGTQQMKNAPKYGNFNPHYQEEDYSDKRWANSGIYVTQPSKMPKGVEHTGEHAEFAQYLANNFFKKHGFTDEGHALSLASQWSSSERKMNRTWPSVDPPCGEKAKGFATDTEVQNIVDLLSGGHKSPAKQRQHPKVHPETLIVIANPESQERHTSGWGTQQMKNAPKYGNFNPHYQEEDYSDKRWANSGIYVSQPSKMPKGVEHTGEHAEFAQYLANNFFKKHGFTDEGHALSLASQWSSSERKMNRTWPSVDPPGDGSEVSHSWPMGHDSGSSSDEDESACGDTYSMGLGLSGPGLMASVNRRRHSSGGEESLHIPAVFNAMGEPPALKYPTALLDVQLDPKSVRTWPPKNVWQRPSSPQPPNNNQYVVNQQEQLDVHRPLQAQWSDPLSVRHSNVWGPATGSTPVSPASSFTSLNTPQAHGQRPKSTSPRPHPRLDRKYAYNVHQFQSR
ncbi:uncharacterized protein KIAA0355-like [Anneissia japonica]|uniref:uncharacterized protein KIAA0355-like n=1 Tax=Anneissia japonica TaxID=1529436 RepID=UPI0014254C7D|nr:uncharacterized protein KIAA0355-like [Anneissia japonica]